MPDADVYRADVLAAHLSREARGYRLSFVEGVGLPGGFLSSTIPYSRKPIDTPDLHPFFLNLLPEGERLRLLLDAKSPREDLLDVLMRVGWDTIGDVAVVPHGRLPGGEPEVRDFEQADFWEMFRKGIQERPDASVPGAQEKLSAGTVAFGVRHSNIGSGILKLNPPKFPQLVRNEWFFTKVAKSCGIETADVDIVTDSKGEQGLLVRRFDRKKAGKAIIKLHQEDGCQLLDLPPSRKYSDSGAITLGKVADAVTRVCSAPIVEVRRLLDLCIFSYIIGNNDLHAKNVSVLWSDVVRLTPAYDLLSTLPYGLETRMALKIGHKDSNLRAQDFKDFGGRYGVPPSAIQKSIDSISDRMRPWIDRFDEIGFDTATTKNLRTEIEKRIRQLAD